MSLRARDIRILHVALSRKCGRRFCSFLHNSRILIRVILLRAFPRSRHNVRWEMTYVSQEESVFLIKLKLRGCYSGATK